MQGGALSLAAQATQAARAIGADTIPSPDVLFASDMLDLPTFLSLVDARVASGPTLLYFHENQLTYPLPPGVERDLTYGMRNIVSALTATRVLFNSSFHRREFLDAVGGLLAAMPDEVPPGVVDELERKAAVLPVGCDLRRFDIHREKALREAAEGRWGDPAHGPLLVWNQRWEYDKAPDRLFEALAVLKHKGLPFRLAMAGPNQGTPTRAFLRAKDELADHIVHWGRVPGDADYAALLWAADVVASTAIHEFFGVAVVEAVYCGCRPVLPWRLSYPELIPAAAHEDVLYREGGLVPALARALAEPRTWSEDWQRTWVARFDWASLGERYDEEIRRCRQAGFERRNRPTGAARR
jgi:glycosyltransferase involved in cell wall biosynthesis